ncbi:flagellar hook-associated protein FlgL [Chitinivibrio alkaliphilus]|uniref:Flagellar hook-associated protein 3 (HAP3) n=1 Tax=Chitinivibrio alkaliphilus ACht1 TaxID=1313304 RepID=U7DAE9_9BACT|nr:flagellar hook-associated protein FlgL [Chitinivibrio alkaliphilus]ERP39374.1 flagellar hook-associated protein 3 (HAP3) [Chitinivibrio alkaliphilus ACht1]
MRTTFNTVNRHTKYVIQDRYSDLARLQRQLATGKKLERPSDSPVDTTNTLRFRSQRYRLEQYKKNMEDAEGWMKVTDTAMASMHDVMKRANELAIQADNDTLSDQERNQIAEEVGQLTVHMASLTNTRYKGNYMFSGSHTDLPARPMNSSVGINSVDYERNEMAYFDGTNPVDPGEPNTFRFISPEGSQNENNHRAIDQVIPASFSLVVDGEELREGEDYSIDYMAGTITFIPDAATHGADRNFAPGEGNYSPGDIQMNFEYVGESVDKYGSTISTNSRVKREIESGISVPVNTTFFDLQVNNSVDPLKSLIEFGSALKANDTDAIQESMDSIQQSSNRILNAQARNGARINFVETTMERNTRQHEETIDQISKLEDADYAEIVADFSVAQTVFNTALQSTAQIMQQSLVNYI